MRQIGDILDKILEVIPETSSSLKDQLKSILESSKFSPPESQHLWWTETARVLIEAFPPDATDWAPWQTQVQKIYMGTA